MAALSGVFNIVDVVGKIATKSIAKIASTLITMLSCQSGVIAVRGSFVLIALEVKTL